jgi:hypothetical protein
MKNPFPLASREGVTVDEDVGLVIDVNGDVAYIFIYRDAFA